MDDIIESVQPTMMPTVNQTLIGKRLEVCVQCDLLCKDGAKTGTTNR